MEPVRDMDYKLVDVLNAILDTGVLINADVIITVSGVPLLGINLRAALGGMATMLDYGLMEAWDDSIRKHYTEEVADRKLPLANNEKIILSTFGSHYYNQGISRIWRHGIIHLTNKRLMLSRTNTREILFETPIEKIRALMHEEDPLKKDGGKVCMRLENGEAVLRSGNSKKLKDGLEKSLTENGIVFEYDIPANPSFSDEKIIQNVWFLSPPSDIIGETWMPGHMHITNERIYWTHKADGKILFSIPVKNIIAVDISKTKPHFASGIPTKADEIFKIIYKDSDFDATTLFSTKKINAIKNATNFLYPQTHS